MASLTNELLGPETSETSNATHLPFPDLLLPGDSPHDLANLQAAWSKDFPGTTQSILTLRDDLIRADWSRRRARLLFHQLQSDLYLTGLPIPHWDRLTQKIFHFLERHQARTQLEFRAAFQLLHSLKSAPSKPAAPPPPPKYVPAGVDFHQNAAIKIVDGKVVTETDFSAMHFLRPDIQAQALRFTRHFYFHDKHVPEPYQYVLQHAGVSYAPAHSIYITYTPAEFARLCRLELDSQSEYLLDGERLSYRRSPHDESPEGTIS
jgi:hypothetical protein